MAVDFPNLVTVVAKSAASFGAKIVRPFSPAAAKSLYKLETIIEKNDAEAKESKAEEEAERAKIKAETTEKVQKSRTEAHSNKKKAEVVEKTQDKARSNESKNAKRLVESGKKAENSKSRVKLATDRSVQANQARQVMNEQRAIKAEDDKHHQSTTSQILEGIKGNKAEALRHQNEARQSLVDSAAIDRESAEIRKGTLATYHETMNEVRTLNEAGERLEAKERVADCIHNLALDLINHQAELDQQLAEHSTQEEKKTTSHQESLAEKDKTHEEKNKRKVSTNKSKRTRQVDSHAAAMQMQIDNYAAKLDMRSLAQLQTYVRQVLLAKQEEVNAEHYDTHQKQRAVHTSAANKAMGTGLQHAAAARSDERSYKFSEVQENLAEGSHQQLLEALDRCKDPLATLQALASSLDIAVENAQQAQNDQELGQGSQSINDGSNLDSSSVVPSSIRV